MYKISFHFRFFLQFLQAITTQMQQLIIAEWNGTRTNEHGKLQFLFLAMKGTWKNHKFLTVFPLRRLILEI